MGEFLLIIAGPNVGKSSIALDIAVKTKVPALYFSADSGPFQQMKRSFAIITGKPQDFWGRVILEKRLHEYEDEFKGLAIRMNYKAGPSLEDIENNLEAYGEVFGVYPDLIVVDNMTNVKADFGDAGSEGFAGLENLGFYFNEMSRETEAAVIGTHHATGPYVDGNKPIPTSGVKGQVSGQPSQIWTVHKEIGDDWTPTTLNVSPVKMRDGQADPSGETFVKLLFDGETMQITDPLMVGV